jgi:hypothetical protein
MDAKTTGNYALLAGLFAAMLTMFNQVNDHMDDRMQAETNRRFEAVLETIVSFERRVSRIEGRLDAQNAEAAP